MQLNHFRQRGDTIVEVLVSIAVIGAVLGGAYVVVNGNTRNNQAAQERSTAVKVAESQLELLRSYAEGDSPLPSGRFCFDPSSPGAPVVISGVLPSPDNNPGSYPLQCQMDDGLATDRFVAGIEANGSNTFTVYVNWDGATGKRSQVSIAYKVYQ